MPALEIYKGGKHSQLMSAAFRNKEEIH